MQRKINEAKIYFLEWKKSWKSLVRKKEEGRRKKEEEEEGKEEKEEEKKKKKITAFSASYVYCEGREE